MELLEFTGTIKNLDNINNSLIPIHLLNNNDNKNKHINIKNIWDFLLNDIFNNKKFGFNLNYIKVVTYNSKIIVIINDNNDIIIIDIIKCYKLTQHKKSISMFGVLSPGTLISYYSIEKQYSENMVIIKKFKNDDNIIKINLIDGPNYHFKKYDNYNYKLIILSENHKLYSIKIINSSIKNTHDRQIVLLSNNIYDYYLFEKNILIRKTIEDNEKELYFIVNKNNIFVDTFNIINQKKNKNVIIDIKKNNIIKKIYIESMNHFTINNISDNYIVYILAIDKLHISESFTSQWELLSYNQHGVGVISTKFISNGVLISHFFNFNFYIKCIFDSYNIDEFIEVKIKSSRIYELIMSHTYYILENDIYISFILLNYGIFTYNTSTKEFMHHCNKIIHYNQLKTNEVIYMHKPYLTLNCVIKNKHFKSILMMLVHHFNNKLNIYVPFLCWDIIFNFIKQHDFLKISKSETKKKRKLHSSSNLTNKKQKI